MAPKGREARPLLPPGPQVHHLDEAVAGVGEAAFVDDEPRLHLSLGHHGEDAVVAHLHGDEALGVEGEEEVGGGVPPRDRHPQALQSLEGASGHHEGPHAPAQGPPLLRATYRSRT